MKYSTCIIYYTLGAQSLFLCACVLFVGLLGKYAFRPTPMMQKLLSPAPTSVFIHDMSLRISSRPSSPPLSSLSPLVSRSNPQAFYMATHMVLRALQCMCVCLMSVNLFGLECHFQLLHITYTHA